MVLELRSYETSKSMDDVSELTVLEEKDQSTNLVNHNLINFQNQLIAMKLDNSNFII